MNILLQMTSDPRQSKKNTLFMIRGKSRQASSGGFVPEATSYDNSQYLVE